VTVDRTSLVSYPTEYEKIAEDVSKNLIQEVISITREHISKHNLTEGEVEYDLLWKFIFDKIGFADSIFINELSYTDYGNILWPGIEKAINEKISIKTFLKRKNLEFMNYKLSTLDTLTEKLILFKLCSAKQIDVTQDSVKCESEALYKVPFIGKRNDLDHNKLLIKSDSWPEKYSEFDIVSTLFPLIPETLFNAIGNYDGRNVNDRVKVVHSYSNGITAFFDQDPVLVNETLGLYNPDSSFFREDINRVYQFHSKRANFGLMEINNRHGDRNSKERNIITAFVAPRELSDVEKENLEKIKVKDQSYYNGVTNGWSILVTGGRNHNNIIIMPGKKSRKELSSALLDEFWKENKDIKFFYLNGEEMKKLD
jgi:hypothetical protein